jgi:hypothetical protein
MDEILNEQFERVERALTTLVDSITAYNPNTQVAIDLVAADDELSKRLDQRMRLLVLLSTLANTSQSPDTRQTAVAFRPYAQRPKRLRTISRLQ